MKREEFKVDDIYTYRYRCEDPDYALIILHGVGAWGGLYDDFAYPFSERGVDIWTIDLPGFGDSGVRGEYSGEESYRAIDTTIQQIRKNHDKPIFVLGSSLGTHPASASWPLKDVAGIVISSGATVAGGLTTQRFRALFDNESMRTVFNSPLGEYLAFDLDKMIDWEKNYGDLEKAKEVMAHPKHTSLAKLESIVSMMCWEPPRPPAENTKPVLMLLAARDELSPLDEARAELDTLGGPKEELIFDSTAHQVMWAHFEEYSRALDSWCRSHV